MPNSDSIVRFIALIDHALPPQPSDRSAMGTLPARAVQYCEALTSASRYGWWIFPPMDMQILWDGADIFWCYEGSEDWMKLAPAAQFPGFAAAFDNAAPEDLKGFSPPFLTAIPDTGILQIWTGLIARTEPNWHLLLRPPANLPLPGGIFQYEGIVETDHWFGPLFINLRITKSDTPIRLKADFPLTLAQPVRPLNYAKQTLASISVDRSLACLTDPDWDAYRNTVVIPNMNPDRAFGAYAGRVRKGRAAHADVPLSIHPPADHCPYDRWNGTKSPPR